MAFSYTITGRLNADQYEQIKGHLEDALANGYNKSDIVWHGLIALFEGIEALPFADNAEGELARLKEQQASQQAIMAQFDVLNDRLDIILQKLEYLHQHGFSATAQAIIEEHADDVPDSFLQDMRERFQNHNK